MDETEPVAVIAEYLATKLNFPRPDEFSLKVWDEALGANRWLKSMETLAEQSIDPLVEPLQLKKQYFFLEDDIIPGRTGVDAFDWVWRQQAGDVSFVDELSDEALHREFVQALDAVNGATFPVALSRAVKFAALQCQVRFGDRDTLAKTAEAHKDGLRLSEVIFFFFFFFFFFYINFFLVYLIIKNFFFKVFT